MVWKKSRVNLTPEALPGKVDAGATASSNGLNLLGGILNLDIGQLLDVLQVYIPIIQRRA